MSQGLDGSEFKPKNAKKKKKVNARSVSLKKPSKKLAIETQPIQIVKESKKGKKVSKSKADGKKVTAIQSPTVPRNLSCLDQTGPLNFVVSKLPNNTSNQEESKKKPECEQKSPSSIERSRLKANSVVYGDVDEGVKKDQIKEDLN